MVKQKEQGCKYMNVQYVFKIFIYIRKFYNKILEKNGIKNFPRVNHIRT